MARARDPLYDHAAAKVLDGARWIDALREWERLFELREGLAPAECFADHRNAFDCALRRRRRRVLGQE